MSGSRRRQKSYPIPKQGPPPPPPRPAKPITRGEVLRWARHVEAMARKTHDESNRALPPDLVLTLEQSIRRLLDPTFRSEFSEALYGEQQLAVRSFFASDPTRGRELLRKWGVINVIPPFWNESLKRYSLLASFHVPIFHWPARGSLPGEEPSIRLMLDRAPMTWHPQYILRCRLCGWPQGGLGRAEAFSSNIPTPHDQLNRLLEARAPGRRKLRARTIYRELVESFGEEIWGFKSANFAMDKRRGDLRQPRSGKIADLLDETMGYVETYQLRIDIDPSRMFLRRVGPRLRVLRWILRRLRCQVCDRVDSLRFVPRLMFPLDLDVTERAQAEFAYELARDLMERRGLVHSESFAKGIFWFPGSAPHLRPVQVADRIRSLCEDARVKRPNRPVDPRLAAMWVIARVRDVKRWGAFEALVLDSSQLPVEEDDLATEQIGPLKDAVLLASRGKKPGQAAGPVLNLLHDERYRSAGNLLLEHYRSKIIPKTPKKRHSKARHRRNLPR
jgi:hypothetical protein